MKLKKLIAENLFPRDYTCDLCGVETFGDNLCKSCKKSVPFNDGATCPVCGRKTVRPEICLECKDIPPQYKTGVSALVYKDGAAKLIYKFKNGGAYLKEFFADLLFEKLKALNAFECIVYVPMFKKDIRARGYNQSKLLARAVSERTNVPVVDGVISKVKSTKAQKSLTKKERAENLKGCFKVEKPDKIKDKSVLVVDDVLTAGATADEIAKILIKAGAVRVYFAAAASVEYKLIKTENASDL